MKSTIHESIISQPSYWIEAVNGILFDAVSGYMQKNNLNRTQMAGHLGISKGRLSQILNDGNINFSLEKIIDIALKVGKYPVLTLEDRDITRHVKMHKEEDLSLVRRTLWSGEY